MLSSQYFLPLKIAQKYVSLKIETRHEIIQLMKANVERNKLIFPFE